MDQEVKRKIEKLIEKLRETGIKFPETKFGKETELNLRTLIVKNIPENGKLRFGMNRWQQSIQVLKFGEEEGKKIKNLRITGCKNLVQLDLSNLANLEKLSLRNSKWDNVKGAKNIVPKYKLVVKNSEGSLSWTEGTNVGTVEVDKQNSK